MAADDTELIARVLANEDQDAFGDLVRRYQSPLRCFLAKLTGGDQHSADDLAQESFVRAWQNLDTFRGRSRFSTSLFGIAYNQWRMFRRAHNDVVQEFPPDEMASAAPSEIGPPPGARMDLEAALRCLTEPERASIVLCCQNGFTHEETSQALGLPVGTVKTHVLRGKEKLRRQLL